MTRLRQMFARKGPELAGLAILALVALLQFADLASLERVRMMVFDGYQRAAPREDAGGARVAVVDIDEESIEALGQWPWPRSDIASLTRNLGAAGARAVVFDIAFAEADRTSPEQIAARYRQVEGGAAIARQLADLPSHDADLAASFASVPVVVGYFLDSRERGRAVEPKAPFTIHGSLPRRYVPGYQGAIQSLPAIDAAAAGAGFVTRGGDADEIVRRVPLVAIHRDQLVPSLSLEAVRVAEDAGNPDLLTSDGSGETLRSPGAAVAVRLGGQTIPVNSAGEIWVHFARPDTASHLSAGAIITGAMPTAELARAVGGRIVLVGGSAVGLNDQVSTPLSDRIGGVSVQAAAVEQLLTGHFLERPDWALGLELLAVLLLGGALAFYLPRLGAITGLVTAGLAIAGVVAASWLAFTQARFLLDPTYPVLAIGVIYISQTAMVFLREERQRRYIHAAFDRYLSPELVRQIAASPDKLELGGEEREMSVLMCDVRGFSRISEQYSPRQVIDFLIEFLTPMSDILLARKATIDKYIGDAILAFWNAPLDDPDQYRNAARAALQMIATTDRLNREMPQRKGVVWPGEVKIGIGLNAGLCCVGNMGSRQRLNYSLIGDTVNVAARLEGQTKYYRVPIIVGHALALQLPGFALLELDLLRVVGREAPETIHALLGDEQVAGQQGFAALVRTHEAMLAAYRAQHWQQALDLLAEGAGHYAEYGMAGLAELMATRIERLQGNPPPADWDGVFEATEK